MCKINNQTRKLGVKDFYNAFYRSEIKDSQARCTIRNLMYGEAMEIAAEIAYQLYLEAIGEKEAEPSAHRICLSDRQDEFKEALGRGFEQDFEVYHGWDKDEFFVVNQTNKSEYKVILETVDGKLEAECECKDYVWRKRTCKHIGQVLLESLFDYQTVGGRR